MEKMNTVSAASCAAGKLALRPWIVSLMQIASTKYLAATALAWRLS